jgi:predicted DNA-binding transcriptional regulator YafY
MKVHPQLLKEFNNRWFVLATHKGKFITLALDRIIKIEIIDDLEYLDLEVNGDEYYKEVVGVTVSNSRAQRVQFWIDKKNAPYVITKPFHASQRTIETREDGTIFNILVQVNFELERLILGFGDSIEVLKPLKLRERMQKKLRTAIRNYAPKEI